MSPRTPAGHLHALAEVATLAASPSPPRPLPPAPWPVQGLTQGAVVLERLVEAVRFLEVAVWGLKLEQTFDAAGMPRVLHRIDAGAGGTRLACRPEGGAPTQAQAQAQTQTSLALRVTLWDGEARYVTSGGLLSRDRSHARIFGSEAEATQYAELHLDPKTERVISVT